MNPILENLTFSQREAVTHTNGPLMVLAGAGSGKTRVVTHRIAYLIDQGVSPDSILALTFTNKAAQEMKERIYNLCQTYPPRFMGTFHSISAKFLRYWIHLLNNGRDGSFLIFPPEDQLVIIRQIITKTKKDLEQAVRLSGLRQEITPHFILYLIEQEKIGNVKKIDNLPLPFVEIYQKMRLLYEEELKHNNALDFNDLLLMMVQLLQHHPTVRERLHHQFQYIIVDEYQDTNQLQYQLLNHLTHPQSRNIHVTGDPDQAIYSWRGANYHNIFAFEEDYPDAKIIRLEENFRSTANILLAADHLIHNNRHRYKKNLIPTRESGDPVQIVETQDEVHESEWITNKVQTWISEGRQYDDIAILYRTNAQSRAIEESFIHANIPYHLVGGIKFYERQEIKDFCAWLFFLHNPKHTLALQRIIKIQKGIGAAFFQHLSKLGETQNLAPGEILFHPNFELLYPTRISQPIRNFRNQLLNLRQQINSQNLLGIVTLLLKETPILSYYQATEANPEKLQERIENLESFVNYTAIYAQNHPEATLTDFLHDIALMSEHEDHETVHGRVTLLTLHSAKGLEFPCVIICGVEEGFLPHIRVFSDYGSREEFLEAYEEERRLLFVGMTRAQEKLVLTYSRSRIIWGSPYLRNASPFLLEIIEQTPSSALVVEQLC